jgi:hypothetical protein
MVKKIALLLSGNIRKFYYDNSIIEKSYKKLVNNQNIDVFIYTDNNDFYYNDFQYLSNKLNVSNNYNSNRYYNKLKFIEFEEAYNIIETNLRNTFGESLKDLFIEEFNENQIDDIYDKNNINHVIFMESNHSSCKYRKKSIMSNFYKLYKCYNLLVNYENKNNIKYDIIIKSRFDGIFYNLDDYDLRSFNFENRVYVHGTEFHIFDWWIIGNRYIMDKYCNYYLNISENLINKIYLFLYRENEVLINYEIIKNCDDIISYKNKKNDNDRLYLEDISDSSEFGLTYLLEKYNYSIANSNIHFDLLKFY